MKIWHILVLVGLVILWVASCMDRDARKEKRTLQIKHLRESVRDLNRRVLVLEGEEKP